MSQVASYMTAIDKVLLYLEKVTCGKGRVTNQINKEQLRGETGRTSLTTEIRSIKKKLKFSFLVSLTNIRNHITHSR